MVDQQSRLCSYRDYDEPNYKWPARSEFGGNPPSPPGSGGKTPKQWKLSTLLFFTTLIAVAASGYSRGEVAGVWTALFSFWFMCLGFACVVAGITSRISGRFFLLAAGVIMLGLGMLAFATFPYW